MVWWRAVRRCAAGRPTTRKALSLLLALALLLLATPSGAGMNVREVAEDELDHIRQQFALPPFTLALVDRFGSQGNTVVGATPSRFTILLWDHYWREDQLRKVTAHEAAHVLFGQYGLPQSEAQADLFAACFGTGKARSYAESLGVAGDCADLARNLQTAISLAK